MQRTLRQWQEWWQHHDLNNDIESSFEGATTEEWETLCELNILLVTEGGTITSVTLQIVDPEESVLAEYTYEDVSYELGRPELRDLLKSLNQDEDEDEDDDDDGNEDDDDDDDDGDEDELENLEEYEEFK